MKKFSISKQEKKEIKVLYGLIQEQVVDNVTELVKGVVGFIWSMNIVPGPIDGAKLLYSIYQSGDPVKSIKEYVRGKIKAPGEKWTQIERGLDGLGSDLTKFKNILYLELKKKLGM